MNLNINLLSLSHTLPSPISYHLFSSNFNFIRKFKTATIKRWNWINKKAIVVPEDYKSTLQITTNETISIVIPISTRGSAQSLALCILERVALAAYLCTNQCQEGAAAAELVPFKRHSLQGAQPQLRHPVTMGCSQQTHITGLLCYPSSSTHPHHPELSLWLSST